jgi:Fe-S oxidoreductase
MTCCRMPVAECPVAETVEHAFLRPLQQCARRVIVFSIFRPHMGKSKVEGLHIFFELDRSPLAYRRSREPSFSEAQ